MSRIPRHLGPLITFTLRLLKDPFSAQALGLWAAAFTAGLISVTYARLFKALESQFVSLLESHPYHIFALSPLCLVLSWWLVRRFAPEAGGSGIPQIMAANELDYHQHQGIVDRLLSKRVAVVKIVSSLVAVLGGGAIGREGPTLQISACVFHFFGKRVRRHYPLMDSHTWIIAGAAAGLASAFNTPLGGIVYAIEEMGTQHFHRIKTSLFTSVIIAGLVSQWILGPYLYLGYPRLEFISFSFLPYTLLIGLLSGGLGALCGMALSKTVVWKARFTRFSFHLPLALGAGLLIATLAYLTPQATGSGAEVINALLFKGEAANFPLMVYRILATGITYLTGAAGGIFAPSLSIGAVLGSWVEQVIATGHPNLMVLLGMIGFLTGVTRTPFTSFILVLEMTDRHSAIFPMMLCALIANGVAKLIQPEGFYETVKAKFLKFDTYKS